MGTQNRLSVRRPCCDAVSVNPGCNIAPAWECDIKDGIDSADVTGWSVDAGTWNAVQYWESGTTADALETTSSSASISCDTQQSSPLNDEVSVKHVIKIADAADEATVMIAGITVTFSGSGMSIGSLAGSTRGLVVGAPNIIRICTWTDSETGNSYIGVDYLGYKVVAETTLGTNGATSFGTGSVTSKVSFHHTTTPTIIRSGNFYHNTPRTDGSGLDCSGCSMVECAACPGGDAPRYLTVEIDGLKSRFHESYYDCDPYQLVLLGHHLSPNCGFCETCEDWNGVYIFDLATSGLGGCAGPRMGADSCDAGIIWGVPCNHTYFYFYVSVVLERCGSGWRVVVYVAEQIRTVSFDPTRNCLAYTRYLVEYHKTYSDSVMCTEIDDDLEFVAVLIDRGFPVGCVDYDNLDIHVTASD